VRAWVVVMIVVVAVAAALTVYGALSDRAKNRRRAAEMLGPPKRDIPNLPADARSPQYVTEAQARRRPDSAGPARTSREPVDTTGERTIDVGYASPSFVTETGAREVVLEDPWVLVCGDPVETIRELLPALEQALKTVRPLVVVAPSIAPDVLGTLEVNAIQGKIPGVAVLADDAVRQQVIDASGALPIDSTDRRSGWLDPAALGHAARWTSTRTSSRIAPMTRTEATR
jgi:hypothetical protein